MPDPEPSQPPPRPVPFWKWMLLLTPSVPMLLAPLVASARDRRAWDVAIIAPLGIAIETFFWSCCIAIALSYCLGVLLEKWLSGKSRIWLDGVFNGTGIFIVNFLIAWAGCAVGAAFHK